MNQNKINLILIYLMKWNSLTEIQFLPHPSTLTKVNKVKVNKAKVMLEILSFTTMTINLMHRRALKLRKGT